MLLNAHTLEFFTLSHTLPLHDSHLNTGYLIAELQANLAQNKANTWLNKFNLTESEQPIRQFKICLLQKQPMTYFILKADESLTFGS